MIDAATAQTAGSTRRLRRAWPGRAAAVALLAAATLSAGCSAGGPRSDGFQEIGARDADPAFGFDQFGRYAFGFDGAKLRLDATPAVDAAGRPTKPKLVVVAVHGYGEYADLTYGEVADAWSPRGVATYAYDQRGFGRNTSRGAWPGGDALIDDLAHVVRAAKKAHPETPLALIGHSMGGAVVMSALGEGRAPDADAAVLLAPATLGGDTLADYLRALLWLYTAVAADERLEGSGLGAVTLTDNPEAQARLDADPFYLRQGAPREYLGVVRLMDRAVAQAENVRVPTLLIWGAKDEIIPRPAIENALARMPASTEYLEVPEGYHLLVRDTVGPDVRQAALDFLSRSLPAE